LVAVPDHLCLLLPVSARRPPLHHPVTAPPRHGPEVCHLPPANPDAPQAPVLVPCFAAAPPPGPSHL